MSDEFDLSYYTENNADMPIPSDSEEALANLIEAIHSFSEVASRQIECTVRRAYDIDQDRCLPASLPRLLAPPFLATLQDLFLYLEEEKPEALHTLFQSLAPTSGARYGSNQIPPVEGGGLADVNSTDANDQKSKILSLILGAMPSGHTSPTVPEAEGRSVPTAEPSEAELGIRAILAKMMLDHFNQWDVMRDLGTFKRMMDTFRSHIEPPAEPGSVSTAEASEKEARLTAFFAQEMQEDIELKEKMLANAAEKGTIHTLRAGIWGDVWEDVFVRLMLKFLVQHEETGELGADKKMVGAFRTDLDGELCRDALDDLVLELLDEREEMQDLGAGEGEMHGFRADTNEDATDTDDDATDEDDDATDEDEDEDEDKDEDATTTVEDATDTDEDAEGDPSEELPRRVVKFWGGGERGERGYPGGDGGWEGKRGEMTR